MSRNQIYVHKNVTNFISQKKIVKLHFSRRPGHWNVDAVRHHTLDSDLIVSPGCSRNGSSGFSSGEASTNSSATTPPPLITNHILESKSILEEAELQNAPWFQDAMPR